MTALQRLAPRAFRALDLQAELAQEIHGLVVGTRGATFELQPVPRAGAEARRQGRRDAAREPLDGRDRHRGEGRDRRGRGAETSRAPAARVCARCQSTMIAARVKETTRSSIAGAAPASCTPPAAAISAAQKLSVREAQVEKRIRQALAEAQAGLRIDQRIDGARRQSRDLLEPSFLRELPREIEESQVDRAEGAAVPASSRLRSDQSAPPAGGASANGCWRFMAFLPVDAPFRVSPALGPV